MHLTDQMVVLPFPLPDSQWLLRNHTCFANSLISLLGKIDNPYPKNRLLATTPLLHAYSLHPLSHGPTAFTDWGNKGPHKQYIKETMTLSFIFSSSQINPQFKEVYVIFLVLTYLKKNIQVYIQTAFMQLTCFLD